MFGRREYRGRGMYDSTTMGHPAHHGMSIWQRRMVERWQAEREPNREFQRDYAGEYGMRQMRNPQEYDYWYRRRTEIARDVRARPRDIWEEQERFGARFRGERDRDRAGNPFA